MDKYNNFIDISQFGLKATQQSENRTLYELIGKEGYGKMLVCKLFPGIDIYYNDYNTTNDFSGEFDLNTYLQISYSYEGMYEFELKDRRCISLGEGELMVLHNIYESRSRFPQGVFKGFGILFDMDTVKHVLKSYFEEFSIDLTLIINSLCVGGNVFVMRGNKEIQNILEAIYLANPSKKLAYIKIKVLELLHLLSTDDDIEIKYKAQYYEKNTVIKMKHIKEHLTEDLSKHTTIEQLAQDHKVTKTMLKACFKDIYGVPPYEFLKKSRMNQAALLIKKGQYLMNEVAGLVGYQNASKFSSAFKDVMGVTPSEYSRRL